MAQYERQSDKREAEELMETLDSQWEDVRGLISQPVSTRRERERGKFKTMRLLCPLESSTTTGGQVDRLHTGKR